MTKEDFAQHLAAFLKIAFTKADPMAHKEMESISLEIGRWIEELIDTRIARAALGYDLRLTEKDRRALNEPIRSCDSEGKIIVEGDPRFYWP